MLRNTLVLAALLVLGSAAQARPGPDPSAEFQRRYHALAQEGQPAAGANALDLIGPVAERIKAVTADVIDKQFPGEKPEMVDLQALTREAATPREKEIARAVLAVLVNSDVPKLTAELAAAPRSVKGEGQGLLIGQLLPQAGLFRKVARFQSGRMTLAAEAGDSAEWLTAFAEAMRTGQQAAEEPVLISSLVGIAIQSLAMDGAQRLIAAGCDVATLEKMVQIMRATPLQGLDKALRGEQLMAEDAMEFAYDAGPAGMRYLQTMGGQEQRPARPAKPAIAEGQDAGPGLPERGAHRKLIAEYYDHLRAYAALPAAERKKAIELRNGMKRTRESSLILELVTPAMEKAIGAWDQLRAERAGLLMVIALERYRAAKGSYPTALSELPKSLSAEVAVDPYAGKPLGYLPPSRGPYEGSRAYVLYAVGADAEDDGGRVDFKDPTWVNRTNGTGDLLLNRYAPARK